MEENVRDATCLLRDLEGRRVHFIGVGGSGMSSLAHLARAFGARCTGSDAVEGPRTRALARDGVRVATGPAAGHLPPDCELVVRSAAIRPDDPEVLEARRRRLPVLKYAEALGGLADARTGVAIAGTHGKSSTTAMLSHVLVRAGADPSCVLGAVCPQLGGGARAGRSDLFVVEACEYDRSFHHFAPRHAAVLNVDADHLDCYGTLEALVEAFAEFARRVPPDGTLLVRHEDPHRPALAAVARAPVVTVGFAPGADWQVQSAPGGPGAPQTVGLWHRGRLRCRFSLPLPGAHMAYDAAVAAVLAHRLGVGWPAIGDALADFRGLERRMQRVGVVGGVTVVDDYGHHPTEIAATLAALRRHHAGAGRLLVVFEPHQHARTRLLLPAFADSLAAADLVLVPPIWAARDTPEDRRRVSAADLVAALRARGAAAHALPAADDAVDHLRRAARPGDLVVVMGAGGIGRVARRFVETGGPA